MTKPADAEAPPPSYDSIFGELKQQKEQSSNVVDYAKNATGICCAKVAGVVSLVIGILCCVAFGLALPIAEIVIGSKYLYDCPAQRYLPIYLIVMGVFSIVSGGCSSGTKAATRGEGEDEGEEGGGKKKTVGGCCNSLIGSFLFGWFIAGNVWVFKMTRCDTDTNLFEKTYSCFTTDTMYSNTTMYCKSIVYDFVFYETIAKWALLGVVIVFGCLCCCVACCAYCCSSKEEESQ